MKFAANLPETLLRAERTIDKLEGMADGGTFSDGALQEFGKMQKEAQRLGHYALWAIAVAVLYYIFIKH